jgi:signal transduction histidine kinase/ActR/RegA family two-component response regulator
MNSSDSSALTFLAHGGQMGALMRKRDWSPSSLGSPEVWPQSLQTMVGMLLNSKFPMLLCWGAELTLLYNDAYIEILGERHPSALGSRLQDTWADVWDDVRPNVEQAMSGQAVYHINLPFITNRNGYDESVWFTFSYSPVHTEGGQVGGMLCVVMETTDQVVAQRNRTDEVTRLQRLFQQAPGIIAVLHGPTHIFDIANDGYCRFIGRNDSVGKPVRQALPELEGQGFYELLDQVYATGTPYFGNEVPIMLRRGPNEELEQRFVSFIYQPTLDDSGHISGIFVEGIDVTESVRTHQALQASENELRTANRRKDEFLAMLAHELRNPLAPIATAAALLRLGARDETRIRKASDVITRQVEHMTGLVDDLLDVSRVTRGLVTLQEETLSIEAILAEAAEQVTSLIETKRQHFTVLVPDEQLLVRGDRTRFIQIFSNLLNNAAKYTPDHGHITLKVVNDGEYLQVSIEDDGIGIATELLPHVFDLFTQAERSSDRSQGGLGLGLALVKSLLELQGGKVVARSKGLGHGSCFIVSLPLARSVDIPYVQHETNSTGPHTDKHRVIIVDDNEDAARTLQLLLDATGHTTFVAHRAGDALAIARQSAPTFCFLDIGLPDMDGYALARQLRTLPETAKAVVVAMTGYGQAEDKNRAKEAGFDHYFVKPARPADVLKLLAGKDHGIGSP